MRMPYLAGNCNFYCDVTLFCTMNPFHDLILLPYTVLLVVKVVLYITSEDYLSDYIYFGGDFLIVDLLKQLTAKVALKASSCTHNLLSRHTDSPPRLSWPALSESWPSLWPPVQLASSSPLLFFSAPPPAFVSPSLQTSPSHYLWMDRKPTVGVYNGISAVTTITSDQS